MFSTLHRSVLLGVLLLTSVSTLPDILPGSLGPLSLVSWMEGEEAKATIDRLHGRPIPMVSGYVAEYEGWSGGRSAKATLWVSESKSEDEAAGLLDAMVQGLKRGSPAFGHYRSMVYGEQLVHVVLGNGQVHTVYRNGIWVLWLAADPHLPPSVVEDALEVGRTPFPKPTT